jgi:putative tryptophan/tyrosine transport system substrate-binding protein
MEGQVRRRRTASRKPAKAQQTIKAKRGSASKRARNRHPSTLSKDTDVRRLARELAEARQQQAATSEVLRVISTSPSDDANRVRSYVAELVTLSPDVIVAHTPPVIAAVRQVSSSIPIVFAAVLDPIAHGFIDNLARPGGNLTGTTNIEFPLVGKMLQILKELARGMVRAAVMFNTNTNPQYLIYVQSFGAVPPTLAVELSAAAVRGTGEIEAVISELGRKPGGGLIVPPDAFTVIHHALIITLAAHHRLPAIYAYRSFVAEGGLMSYGPDVFDIFRRTASYVDRILRGAKPADLPVEAPVKYDLAINLKTARALGLEAPPTLLATANEVIE